MSLLLLFTGAGTPYTPTNEHYQQWSMGRIGRALALSVAVASTTYYSTWPEQTPPVVVAPPTVGATSPDWFSGVTNRPRGLSEAVRSTTYFSTYPEQPLITPIPGSWAGPDWVTGLIQRWPRLSTAAADTGFKPIMPPRVPEVVYQDGWRCRWTDPPLRLQLSTAVRDTTWMPAMVPRVPDVVFQDGWRSAFAVPVQFNVRARTADGWPWQAYQFAVVAAQTPSDLWWPQWQAPIQFAKAPPRLEGFVVWPGAGYALAAVDVYGVHNERQLYSPARRSVDLLGQVTWPAQEPPTVVVTFQEGWRSAFSTPPLAAARSRDVLGQVVWPAQVASVVFQEGWRQEFSKPQRLTPPPRLEGSISWAAQVAITEYQDGWRSAYSTPPAHLQPRRSTNLLESWPWPGFGYSFVVLTTTPTEWWFTRWNEPPVYSRPPPRAADLTAKGGIVQGRVPEAVFQEGWRSAYSQPPIYTRPKPRLPGEIVRGRPPDAVFQEGWRSAYSQPPVYARPRPRLGGEIVRGRPPDIVYQDGWFYSWREPPIYLKPQPRLPGTISWAPQVVVQVIIVRDFNWFVRWTEPPKRAPRSVASLGQITYAVSNAWPTLCGSVSYTFRGPASVTRRGKPTATMTIRPGASATVRIRPFLTVCPPGMVSTPGGGGVPVQSYILTEDEQILTTETGASLEEES